MKRIDFILFAVLLLLLYSFETLCQDEVEGNFVWAELSLLSDDELTQIDLSKVVKPSIVSEVNSVDSVDSDIKAINDQNLISFDEVVQLVEFDGLRPLESTVANDSPESMEQKQECPIVSCESELLLIGAKDSTILELEKMIKLSNHNVSECNQHMEDVKLALSSCVENREILEKKTSNHQAELLSEREKLTTSMGRSLDDALSEIQRLRTLLSQAQEDLSIARSEISLLEKKARLAKNEESVAKLAIENCLLEASIAKESLALQSSQFQLRMKNLEEQARSKEPDTPTIGLSCPISNNECHCPVCEDCNVLCKRSFADESSVKTDVTKSSSKLWIFVVSTWATTLHALQETWVRFVGPTYYRYCHPWVNDVMINAWKFYVYYLEDYYEDYLEPIVGFLWRKINLIAYFVVNYYDDVDMYFLWIHFAIRKINQFVEWVLGYEIITSLFGAYSHSIVLGSMILGFFGICIWLRRIIIGIISFLLLILFSPLLLLVYMRKLLFVKKSTKKSKKH